MRPTRGVVAVDADLVDMLDEADLFNTSLHSASGPISLADQSVQLHARTGAEQPAYQHHDHHSSASPTSAHGVFTPQDGHHAAAADATHNDDLRPPHRDNEDHDDGGDPIMMPRQNPSLQQNRRKWQGQGPPPAKMGAQNANPRAFSRLASRPRIHDADIHLTPTANNPWLGQVLDS